jgi:hypothetical protein
MNHCVLIQKRHLGHHYRSLVGILANSPRVRLPLKSCFGYFLTLTLTERTQISIRPFAETSRSYPKPVLRMSDSSEGYHVRKAELITQQDMVWNAIGNRPRRFSEM